MSLPCTKCKTTTHSYRKCTEPWPFWKEQLCDRCGLEGHETGAKECSQKSKPMQSCDTCGHENHHYTNMCPIKTKTLKEHHDQYTKTKYVKATGSEDQVIPDVTGPTNLQDVQDMLSNMNIVSSNTRTVPGSLPADTIKIQLAHANLDLCAYMTSGEVATGPEALANFFPVNFIKGNPKSKEPPLEIRKYRIILGKLWKDEAPEPQPKKTNKGGKLPDEPVPVPKARGPKREVARALIEDLLLIQRPPIGIWASDFFSYVVSVGKLYDEMSDAEQYGQEYDVRHFRPGRPGEGFQVVKSKIVYEGLFRREALENYFDPRKPRDVNYLPTEDLRILNLISWKDINMPSFAGARVGSKFYPAKQDPEFSGPVMASKQNPTTLYDLRTGFFSSIRPAHGQLLINVNTTMSAFYAPINLQDWIYGRWSNQMTPPRYEEKELIDVRVVFQGDPWLDEAETKKKKRVIRGFSPSNVQSTFFFEDEKKTKKKNVLAHMKATYKHLSPWAPNAACVNLGSPKDTRWYPADKLDIFPLQVVKKQLQPAYQDLMVKKATKIPAANKQLIQDAALSHLGIVKPKSKTFYTDFGITISNDFVPIRPRKIKIPELRFGQGQIGATNRSKRDQKTKRVVQLPGSWNMTDVSSSGKGGGEGLFRVPKEKLTHIHIIRVGPGNSKYNSNQEESEMKWLGDEFGPELKQNLAFYGFNIDKHYGEQALFPPSNSLDRRGDLKKSLDTAWFKLDKPSLVVIQLPLAKDDPHNQETYANIKWWGDCDRGVATICIKYKTLEHLNPTLFGNLALKINVKIQGTNHYIENVGTLPNTMVVGADVTHPGKDDEDRCPSLAGVVATHDIHFAHYLASARLQSSKNEHIEDLRGMIYERILVFHEKRNIWPDHILFYRDGVSDSQCGMVKDHELPQIKEAVADVRRLVNGQNCEPKITLLVVGKRHHARFFPKNAVPQGTGNIPPGHVFEDKVVLPRTFNFYLQSHDSPLGTARTGHYVVIANDSGYTAKLLQEVTNNLCSMGSRAMHCLSVVTPARYADLLCDRLRCYMKPVLDNRSQGPVIELRTHAQNTNVWGDRRNPTSRNPWHDNVKDIMFYI